MLNVYYVIYSTVIICIACKKLYRSASLITSGDGRRWCKGFPIPLFSHARGVIRNYRAMAVGVMGQELRSQNDIWNWSPAGQILKHIYPVILTQIVNLKITSRMKQSAYSYSNMYWNITVWSRCNIYNIIYRAQGCTIIVKWYKISIIQLCRITKLSILIH